MAQVVVLPNTETAEKIWKEIAYTLTPKVTPYAIVAIAGKACGIRSDGHAFYAVYDLPWIYPANFDWTIAAKERLDTFLNCDCSLTMGPCAYHKVLMQQWMMEDNQRNNLQESDIPEALRGHVGVSEKDPNRSRILRPC